MMDAAFQDIAALSGEKGYRAILDDAAWQFASDPAAHAAFVEQLAALPVLSKNTNELKTGAPGRFDRHRPVASHRSGACRRRCRRFGFSARAGKTPSSNGMPRSLGGDLDPGPGQRWTLRRPGPHLDQNVLAGYRRGSSLGLDSEFLGWPFFRHPDGPVSALSPIWRKRGTRKSRLETNTENEVCSGLIAASLVTPNLEKPRQPRGKSQSSLQCHNWEDWVAEGDRFEPPDLSLKPSGK